MQQPLPFEQAEQWAQSILSQMTLEEKCRYIGGADVFFTQAIERLNIPRVLFSDASAGVVLRDRFFETTYQNPLPKSTAFPAPIMLAATWNTALTHDYAHSIGEQCSANGIGVLLGPGFNLYRISQCGRNFEYMGEDPFLISRMVETYVKAVQSTGTIATLKHFVANNTDYFRRKSNSVVSERALREIYTPAFKAGIDAGAMGVMTAYNLVNGEWTGESKKIITDLLRNTLGFKWLVMTDWWSVYDGKKVATSGQDLEMPASDATADLQNKVETGALDEQHINRMVKSILTTLKAMHLFDKKPQPLTAEQWQKHEATALQTAREGTVLLRNENGLLPLKKDQEILLLGDGIPNKACGGGSSFVKGYDQITQLSALQNIFPNARYNKAPTDEDIKNAPCIILSINTQDAESHDKTFALPIGEERYIKRIVNLNTNVIVVLNTGSGVRMTDWHDKAAAIVYCWYNGQNGNLALAEILSGQTNPSGKLPITIEREFSDSPGAGYIPQGEAIYSGENDEWEKARAVYDVHYKEDVFVGYRWYEHKKISPLYPFGFGLSYSTFEYSGLQLSHTQLQEGDSLGVSFTLTNTGKHAGMETAQLYIKNAPASAPRPVKELKGFKKVELQPGQSTEISLTLTRQDFAYWSESKGDWLVEPGEYQILVGSSSQALHLAETVTL